MRDYGDGAIKAAKPEPEPDRRIVAIHRLVEAEGQMNSARFALESAQKEAAVAAERLEQAHYEVRELLGLSGVADNGNKRADW